MDEWMNGWSDACVGGVSESRAGQQPINTNQKQPTRTSRTSRTSKQANKQTKASNNRTRAGPRVRFLAPESGPLGTGGSKQGKRRSAAARTLHRELARASCRALRVLGLLWLRLRLRL
eukprot:2461537-Rhodomonas_salina.1